MKKILFGTSAMLAVAFASTGGASAAGLTLGMSGGYTFGVGFASYDNGGVKMSDTAVIADGSLTFEGKGTLDNGLTFGGVMKTDVEGAGSSVLSAASLDTTVTPNVLTVTNKTVGGGFNVNESYGYVSGGFGKIVVGHDDGAHDWAVVAPPCVGFSCAADGAGMLFDKRSMGGGDWSFDGVDTSDRMKVSYFTPSIWGLSAGVSWVPNAGSGDSGDNFADTVHTDSSINQAMEAGVKYSSKVGAFSTDMGFGYTRYNQPGAASLNQKDSWAMGVVLGYNNFKIGGNMESDRRKNSGFGVAASYGTGPWSFGASYAQGNSIAGAGTGAKGAAVGVSYELGKGVSLNGGLEWAKVSGDSGFGGGISTSLSF